ncbi:cupin domain-containing protein [Candidatus Pacearchaeota archaeon]|nr:MAG: cupin domain-containing protein [Candidatus Pacearchaeota archaeon]
MEKYFEKRPWGSFERLCCDEKCTVKIIMVNPNSELSLQYHLKRDEFWKVLDGEAEFVVGGQRLFGRKGDEFFIPREMKHQVITRDSSVRFLEISFGDFDENDIVRLKDRYGRV